MSTLSATPSTVYNASEGRKFAADTTLKVVSCATCGVTYAIPERFHRSALAYRGDTPNGWKICCPFGHTWWYVGETEEKRLRRERDEAFARTRATRDLLEHEQRSHSATRGVVTKLKKRASAGTCPCCNRTFQQLARHMETKHPEFVGERDGHLPSDPPKDRPERADDVLAFLVDGPRRWSEIRDHLGLADNQAGNLLTRLANAGEIERIERGVYRRANG